MRRMSVVVVGSCVIWIVCVIGRCVAFGIKGVRVRDSVSKICVDVIWKEEYVKKDVVNVRLWTVSKIATSLIQN